MVKAADKPAEILAAHEEARQVWDELARQHPSITEYQRSLAYSHNGIGNLLRDAGKTAEALAAYERARQIWEPLAWENPKSPEYASALGATLNNLAMLDMRESRYEQARGRLRQAVEWQQKAVAADPAHPQYRQFLANHLTLMVDAAQRLHDTEGTAEAKRELARFQATDPALKALDDRLAAVIRGDQAPTDEAERLRLARRAYDTALHAAAVKLWSEALTANPGLGDDRKAQHRYSAACAAAAAARGKGEDVPPPDESARSVFRRQAREWLRAELKAWTQVSSDVKPGNKELVAQALAHWKQDTDLAGVRDEPDLAILPEAERAEWQALWEDVDHLLAKAKEK
jgi:tetratricopeptide (TPR) repeat protein